MTGAKGLEAAIQAKRLAPETPLVWWSDDENFSLIAYHLRIPAFLPADCSDQELYEAIKPIIEMSKTGGKSSPQTGKWESKEIRASQGRKNHSAVSPAPEKGMEKADQAERQSCLAER